MINFPPARLAKGSIVLNISTMHGLAVEFKSIIDHPHIDQVVYEGDR